MSMINLKSKKSILCLDFSDLEGLSVIAKEKNKQYLSNRPFPHIVIDGLFPDKILEDIILDIGRIDHSEEKNFYGSVKKKSTSDLGLMGETTRRFLLDLNSSNFCNFLEELTGISGLIPDPNFEGGGIHEIFRGGFLKIHTDFNWSKKLKLDRRINMLIYLNKDWDEKWGGALELWDNDIIKHVKVFPEFNRTVIFSTTDFSYHGHPDSLQCPDSISRKSLALYYYSYGRPSKEYKIKKNINTVYVERSGEVFAKPKERYLFLKKLIPSTLIVLLKKIRRHY